MGNCCHPEQTSNVKVHPQQGQKKADAAIGAKLSSIPINPISNTRPYSYVGSQRQSIRSSYYLNQINFVHSVRQPSMVQNQQQIQRMNDSSRLSQFYNTNINVRNTGQGKNKSIKHLS